MLEPAGLHPRATSRKMSERVGCSWYHRSLQNIPYAVLPLSNKWTRTLTVRGKGAGEGAGHIRILREREAANGRLTRAQEICLYWGKLRPTITTALLLNASRRTPPPPPRATSSVLQFDEVMNAVFQIKMKFQSRNHWWNHSIKQVSKKP